MTDKYGYPLPTSTIRVPFTPPGLNKACETVVFVHGELSPGKVPLICVHGGPGAGTLSFIPLVNLSKSHGTTVIMYDQIGCGASTRLPETDGNREFWTMDPFLAELYNVIKHFKLEQYDLLGHSWGGIISIEWALTQPKGLRKLIQFSTPASMPLRIARSVHDRAELPHGMAEVMEKADEDPEVKKTPEYQAAEMEYSQRHM
jgi:proline-specific peptidase